MVFKPWMQGYNYWPVLPLAMGTDSGSRSASELGRACAITRSGLPSENAPKIESFSAREGTRHAPVPGPVGDINNGRVASVHQNPKILLELVALRLCNPLIRHRSLSHRSSDS